MSTSWLWLSIFQSGLSLLRCRTSHHTTLARFSYKRSKVGLGFVLSALLIKDQNLEENSKTYLIMFSLTITRLQGIIPKLMAFQRRWFRHVIRDFGRFASLGTKRIGTWPYLTLPWVTGFQTSLFVWFRFLLSTFWETSHSTLFHCCSNGPSCELGVPSHLG